MADYYLKTYIQNLEQHLTDSDISDKDDYPASRMKLYNDFISAVGYTTIANHVGYRAMLEYFDNQSERLKAFMVRASRPCSECLKCTKGNSKTALFYHDVLFNGENYRLCPSFPKFDWTEISDENMEQIIECIEMQEKYNKQI